MTEANLPKTARIGLVTTRRAQPAADMLAGTVMAKYILHDMMASTTAPMHELSIAHVVALEVPPIVTAKFEHDLLNFVHKLLALNVLVLAVVQPSLRRKSNKAFGAQVEPASTGTLQVLSDMLVQDRQQGTRLPLELLRW